jgi:hypothetical protein
MKVSATASSASAGEDVIDRATARTLGYVVR